MLTRRHGRAVAAAAVVTAAIGCASAPKPNPDLIGARTLIGQAEQSGAQQFASSDLEAARSELRQADQDAKDQPVLSARLAQQASVDAELALARTRAVKAEQALNEVNSGTATLRSESERTQPEVTPMPLPDTQVPQSP